MTANSSLGWADQRRPPLEGLEQKATSSEGVNHTAIQGAGMPSAKSVRWKRAYSSQGSVRRLL